ncbi:MAG: hotdog fold thioesterase [Desulfobacterales bacterium]|nr:hotdog fold thioesterase [Desulfobacterales bacterium]
MELMNDFIKKDRFASMLGIELIEVSQGYAKTKLEITTHHLNGLDMVHGAALFSLADVAFAIASNSYGIPAVAIHISTSYLKAAKEGTLYAEAKEISKSAKLANYDITVTNDQGEKIAIFQCMAYCKDNTSKFLQKENI